MKKLAIFTSEYWKKLVCSFLNISYNNTFNEELCDNKKQKQDYDELNTTIMFNMSSHYTTSFFDDDNDSDSEIKTITKTRIPIKPKDVLSELETIPTNWSLLNLDDKIEIIESKISLIQQHRTKGELQHLLMCLQNRKKLHNKDSAGQEFMTYFSQFDITNEEKIKKLLEKYALKMCTADIFIPEFPKSAIDVMKTFTQKSQELCGLKPIFMVIATEDCFKTVYEKRDPILLVQSPFGLYYHILGAWDQEMLYLPEL